MTEAEKIGVLVKALTDAKFVLESMAMLQGNKVVIPYILNAEAALKAAE